MSRVAVHGIDGLPETMLIPLWAKATETSGQCPIVRDEKAVEIVSRIDYDFSRFERAWLSQVGVSIRTMLLDQAVRDYLRRYHRGVVVNLGAGLDTRFERLGDDRICVWYELDLPQAIALRRRFFEESPRNCFIAKSIFDSSWMDDVAAEEQPVLFIAEGLFMYFTECDVKLLLRELATRFPGAEMLVEMLAPWLVGKSKRHDSLRTLAGPVDFKWGLRDSRRLESWHDRIRLLNEWNYFDYHRKRWRFLRWLTWIPGLKAGLNGRIVHLRFEGT